MPCLDCLSEDKTLIPEPLCQGECDENLGCVDIVNSNCVIVNPNLSCLNQVSGITLSVALQAIDAKLCQSISNLNSCKVKVSATDDCCDYLAAKVGVANGLMKATVRTNNCEQLVISHPTWNTVNFTQVNNPFVLGLNGLYTPKASTYYNGAQRVHEVKLNGGFTYTPQLLSSTSFVQVSKLPLGIPAPTTDYYCSYTFIDTNGNTIVYNIIVAGSTTLYVEGQILVKAAVITGAGNISSPFISLDGINYLI